MKIVLKSRRFTLREFIAADAQPLYELNNDPDVIRYTGDQPFESIAQADSLVANYDKYKKFGYGRWSVILNHSNEYLGWCCLNYDEQTRETDIGFRFFKKYWNNGCGTESATAVLAFGIDNLQLKRIIGRTHHGNMASKRVLEKIGMRFESVFERDGASWLKYSYI